MIYINKPAHDNLGGSLAVFLMPPDAVDQIVTDHSTRLKSVTFKSTDNIIKVYCTPETLHFSEYQKDDRNFISLKWFFPNAEEPAYSDIFEYSNKYWLAILLASTGKDYQLLGMPETPLKLVYRFDAGKEVKDLKGTMMIMQGVTKQRSPFIHNPFE